MQSTLGHCSKRGTGPRSIWNQPSGTSTVRDPLRGITRLNGDTKDNQIPLYANLTSSLCQNGLNQNVVMPDGPAAAPLPADKRLRLSWCSSNSNALWGTCVMTLSGNGARARVTINLEFEFLNFHLTFGESLLFLSVQQNANLCICNVQLLTTWSNGRDRLWPIPF